MPHDRLERLDKGGAQRRRRIDRDHEIGKIGERPTWSADDAIDRRSTVMRQLDRVDEVDGYAMLTRAAADGEDEQSIRRTQARDLQPACERALPAVVVRTRRQLGHVVGRRIALDRAQLAKVVDGMRSVTGATSDAQQEKSPSTRPYRRKTSRKPVDLLRIDQLSKRRGRPEVVAAVPVCGISIDVTHVGQRRSLGQSDIAHLAPIGTAGPRRLAVARQHWTFELEHRRSATAACLPLARPPQPAGTSRRAEDFVACPSERIHVRSNCDPARRHPNARSVCYKLCRSGAFEGNDSALRASWDVTISRNRGQLCLQSTYICAHSATSFCAFYPATPTRMVLHAGA